MVVSDADLEVLAQAGDLTQARFLVPADALAGLVSGAELYWQVEAVLPDGSSRTSRTFINRLAQTQ